MSVLPDIASSAGSEVYLWGDFYESDSGPTLLLVLESIEAAKWLDEVFAKVQQLPTAMSITNDTRVLVSNVSDISIEYRSEGADVELRNRGERSRPSFLLSVTAAGRDYIRGLLVPFVEGRSGHQYLTQGGVDDALIELSRGEQHFLSQGDR